jgi:transcriptional regulator with XRE-family HTH domain
MPTYRIRELAAERNVSLSKLSRQADVATAYLYRLADGRENPTVETLTKIARALDVPVRDLFAEDTELRAVTT